MTGHPFYDAMQDYLRRQRDQPAHVEPPINIRAEQNFKCTGCAAHVWMSDAHGQRRHSELSEQIIARQCSACFSKSRGTS